MLWPIGRALPPTDTIVLDLGLHDQSGLDIDHLSEHRAVPKAVMEASSLPIRADEMEVS
jgi:hypothetical protein